MQNFSIQQSNAHKHNISVSKQLFIIKNVQVDLKLCILYNKRQISKTSIIYLILSTVNLLEESELDSTSSILKSREEISLLKIC